MNLKKDLIIGGIGIVVLVGLGWYWSSKDDTGLNQTLPAQVTTQETTTTNQPSSSVTNEYSNDLKASETASVDGDFKSMDTDINSL